MLSICLCCTNKLGAINASLFLRGSNWRDILQSPIGKNLSRIFFIIPLSFLGYYLLLPQPLTTQYVSYHWLWSCRVSWNCCTQKPTTLFLPQLYKLCKWVNFRGLHNPLTRLPCRGKGDKGKATLPLKFVALSLGLVRVKDCTLWICLGISQHGTKGSEGTRSTSNLCYLATVGKMAPMSTSELLGITSGYSLALKHKMWSAVFKFIQHTNN